MKQLTEENLRKAVISVMVLTMLFPPFLINLPGATIFGCGFGFLFSWPQYEGRTCRVDKVLLISEWVFIALLLALHQWVQIKELVLWHLRKPGKNRDQEGNT